MMTAMVSTLKDCVFIFSSFIRKQNARQAVPGVDAGYDVAAAYYSCDDGGSWLVPDPQSRLDLSDLASKPQPTLRWLVFAKRQRTGLLRV